VLDVGVGFMAVWDRRRKGHPEEGASAVEFALVLPVLAALVFGIIGFGIVFAQQLSLSNFSRQAARYGAVDDRTCADITQQVKSSTGTISMNGAAVTVTVLRGTTEALATDVCGGPDPLLSTVKPCLGSPANSNVYVRTDFVSTMIVPFVRPSFNLKGIGTFRCEFS
jgi:Flp pilus assembly protein TadG